MRNYLAEAKSIQDFIDQRRRELSPLLSEFPIGHAMAHLNQQIYRVANEEGVPIEER